jgi:hypothetical protein
MVAVGLMSFIVIGLLVVFSQTQKAFKAGLTQVDVLETGRIASDMMARELEQMAPALAPDYTNSSGAYVRTVNFFAGANPLMMGAPLRQGLPGTTSGATQLQRTNVVESFFFLSKVNQDWVGTGYAVIPDDTCTVNPSVGSLYRYTNSRRGSGASLLYNDFLTNLVGALACPQATNMLANFQRIADGVVHLGVRTFATNGGPLFATNVFNYPGNYAGAFMAYNDALHNADPSRNMQPVQIRNTFWTPVSSIPYEGDSYFTSNAVPAAVELELGILEPAVGDRARAILSAGAAAQRQYLSNHVAQVHIFRERVPIRNVDFSAYR